MEKKNSFAARQKKLKKEIDEYTDLLARRSQLRKEIRAQIREFNFSPEELFSDDKICDPKVKLPTEHDKAVKQIKRESRADFMRGYWRNLFKRSQLPYLRNLNPRSANTVNLGAGIACCQIFIRIMENQVALEFEVRNSRHKKIDIDTLRNEFIKQKVIIPDYERGLEKSWAFSICSPRFCFDNGGYELSMDWIEEQLPAFRSKIYQFLMAFFKRPKDRNVIPFKTNTRKRIVSDGQVMA